MKHLYPQIYLDDAMKNLGEMTEYAAEKCSIPFDSVYRYFIITGYGERWEKGDPQIISGFSGTELWIRVMEKCDIHDSVYPAALVRYDAGFYYWCGYITAFCQWNFGWSFSAISETFKEGDYRRFYPALHTASDDKCAEVFLQTFQSRRRITRLAAYRKNLLMTQQQLADRSGISRRTIEEYESGRKSLSKAGADRILVLSRELKCSPEALLEDI